MFNPQTQCRPVLIFDQLHRQIKGCGRPAASDPIAIIDDGLFLHINLRKPFRKSIQLVPMNGRPMPIQQTSIRQKPTARVEPGKDVKPPRRRPQRPAGRHIGMGQKPI